jgi:hypothetical protein
MPYRMLEELQNRRKEKVAIFLTFENIVGLIIVFFPVFLGTSAFPLLLRGPLCIGAALLGVTATLEVHGLPLYEQLLWRVRGLVRLRTQGQIITPEHLTGAVLQDAPDRALPVHGPIHVVERAKGRPILPTRQTRDLRPILDQNGQRPQGVNHADPEAE